MSTFPIQPVVSENELIVRVVLDLTIYPENLFVEEFNTIINAFSRYSPENTWRLYKVSETTTWDSVDQPKQPVGKGSQLAFLDKVRERINSGWPVEFRLWDEQRINSWSFCCIRVPKAKDGENCSFYRIIMPLGTDPQLLIKLAYELSDGIRYLSGHGGYCFLYNGWKKSTAFSEIYKKARRFWGIDIEDLNLTLPLVKDAIKGVSWLTLVGNPFLTKVRTKLASLESYSNIKQITLKHGMILIAGNGPVLGDRNRGSLDLQPYFEIAKVLESILLKDHPDFSGKFSEEGNTINWLRRFVDPEGWA